MNTPLRTWRPAGDQPTEIIPGLGEEPAPAPAPVKPKRRIPKAVAAVAVVAAATIGGGAIGLALAGNQSPPVSDTAVTSESTAWDERRTRARARPRWFNRHGARPR